MARKRTLRSKMKARMNTKLQLETRYSCPKCLNSNVVTCKRNKNKWRLKCDVCHAKFVSTDKTIEKPIDVYSLWVDNVNDGEYYNSIRE